MVEKSKFAAHMWMGIARIRAQFINSKVAIFRDIKNVFPTNRFSIKKLDQEMGELNQRTLDRSNLLRSNGYNVVEQWECEWLKSSIYKVEKKKKTDILEMEPLIPRNAYFGNTHTHTRTLHVDSEDS